MIESTVNVKDDLANFGTFKYVEAALITATILALNSAPLVLVAAPGVGKVLIPRFLLAQYTFGGIAFATDGVIVLRSTGSGVDIMSSVNNAIFPVVSSIFGLSYVDAAPVATTYIANAGLELSTLAADPTAGDGSMKVQLIYQELTLS